MWSVASALEVQGFRRHYVFLDIQYLFWKCIKKTTDYICIKNLMFIVRLSDTLTIKYVILND